MATYDVSNDEWEDDEPEYVPPSPAVSYASTVPTLPLDDELDDELDNGLLASPSWQPIEVPVLAHYELCNIPGVNNEQGLFATEDIEPGTRIIAERPLFTLPHPGDQLPELMAAYSNLSPLDRHCVDSLRPAHPSTTEQLHNIDEITTKIFAEIHPILIKPSADRTPNENSVFEFLMPKFTYATRVLHTAARWHANRCSMTNLPQDQRAHLPAGTPVSGLFLLRSQMRHSCVPNCFASYNPTTTHLTVHTTRPIAAGDELTVSAFADDMYYLDASARYTRFATWGLTCACEACDTAHPAYDTHESARQRTEARAVLTHAFLSRLHPPPNLPHHPPPPLSLADLDDAQATILALCDDLHRTGCSSAEHVRWRIALITHIMPVRAAFVDGEQRVDVWRETLEQTIIAEEIGRMCFGADREEVRLLGVMREKVEAELEGAVQRVGEMEEEGRQEGVVGGGGARARARKKRFRRRKR
jgi:hypothetical protein